MAPKSNDVHPIGERKWEDTEIYPEGCHLKMVIEIRVFYLQVKELQVLLARERDKE